MDGIELAPVLPQKRERISLVKLERVTRLRVDVDAHNFKARAPVSFRCASRTAEQIE